MGVILDEEIIAKLDTNNEDNKEDNNQDADINCVKKSLISYGFCLLTPCMSKLEQSPGTD
jgi:hypothetical protein